VTIQAQIIEPFIITGVFISIGHDEVHKVEFDNMYQAAEFIHMINFYKDCPSEWQFDKTFGDFDTLRKIVADKAGHDEIDRRREYPPSRKTYAEIIGEKNKPKKARWWPF